MQSSNPPVAMSQPTEAAAALGAEPGQILLGLEQAARDFQLPSTRAIGERRLLEFRQSGQALLSCFFIFENTATSFVLFQVASALKENYAKRYPLMNAEEKERLKNFLINYLLNHRPEAYVRQQILSTVAVMVKRGWLDLNEQQRMVTLDSIPQLLAMPGLGKTIAIPFAAALLDEFSSKKASAVGLTWNFHHQCKHSFEATALRKIFETVLQTVHTLLQRSDLDMDGRILFNSCINCLDSILQWEFSNGKTEIGGHVYSTANSLSSLNGTTSSKESFPASWADLMIRDDFLNLFFNMMDRFKTNEDVAHRISQCIVQLAGLNGPILPPGQTRVAFATSLTSKVLALSQMEMDPSLRLGVSQIIRRLVENFGLTVLLQIPVFQEFLAHITELSGRIIIESNNEVDDTWYMESFDELLESWASMLVQLDALNEPGYDVPQGINLQHFNLIFREASSHVFQRYVSTRIDFANETLDEELLGDMKDREIYADQLISIALLGRLLGSKGILFLHQQLVDRMQRFEQLLSQQTLDETMLHSLHDHLHWILLISAYVVADSQQGEVPCIPAVFLADRVPDQEAHPIIALFQTTLQFLAFLTSKSVSSQSHLLSPLVVETLIWFLSRFTATYFHPSTEGGDVPPSILNAFTGSSCAQFLSFLIEQLQPALIHWSAELEVVESVTELLESLSEKESIRRDIMALPRWKSTAAFLVEHLSAIVGEMHCRLIAALVKLGSCHQISGSASENAQSMDMAYFEAIFLMIEKRLMNNVKLATSGTTSQDPSTLLQQQDCMELFSGLATSLDTTNKHIVLAFLAKHVDTLLQLMEHYRAIPEIIYCILQFWERFMERLALLGDDIVGTHDGLIKRMARVVEVYRTSSVGEKPRDVDDGDFVECLFTILLALSHLLTLANDSAGQDEPAKASLESYVNIVLFGLNELKPLFQGPALLQSLPQLTIAYTRLVGTLVRENPRRIAQLCQENTPLYEFIFQSLEMTLHHVSFEVSRQALEAVGSLACELIRLRLCGHIDGHGRPSMNPSPPAPLPGGPTNDLHPLTASMYQIHQRLIQLLLFQDSHDPDLFTSGLAARTFSQCCLCLPVPLMHDSMQKILDRCQWITNESIAGAAGAPISSSTHQQQLCMETTHAFIQQIDQLCQQQHQLLLSSVQPSDSIHNVSVALRNYEQQFEQLMMPWLLTVRALIQCR